MTLLHLRPPQATSKFVFYGFLFLAVYVSARRWVFCSETALVARLLLPSVICTALALSSPVAGQLSLECGTGQGKQLNLIAALCWTNKLTTGDKGQVKLMAGSPVLLWVRVQ